MGTFGLVRSPPPLANFWQNLRGGVTPPHGTQVTLTPHSIAHAHARAIQRGSPRARPPACHAGGTNCGLTAPGLYTPPLSHQLMEIPFPMIVRDDITAETYCPIPFSTADYRRLQKVFAENAEIRCRIGAKSPAAFDRNQVPVCSDFCSVRLLMLPSPFGGRLGPRGYFFRGHNAFSFYTAR